MATITPPRSQHNLKASTLPQTARPPSRKPRGLKAFWRRLSHSPRPDEKEKRPSKAEKIRSTVSSQSLEAVLSSSRGRPDGSKSPSGRRASGNTPEKRKSSFGTFFSAFTHGKHEKDGRQHKKHSKSKAAAASSAEEDVNAATTPGSQGNGQLTKFDYKYEGVPATTVPSLSPHDIKSITSSPRVMSRATTSVMSTDRPRPSVTVAGTLTQQAGRLDSTQVLDSSNLAATHLVTVKSSIKQLGQSTAASQHLSSENTTNGRPATLNLPTLQSNVPSSSHSSTVTSVRENMPGVVPVASSAFAIAGYRDAMGQGDEVMRQSTGSAAGGISHRMQSSIDTIGTCSLDVQATTATTPSAGHDLVNGSENTLRSISLSHPKSQVPADSRCSLLTPEVRSPPSYLGIACAVSGYSSLNRYDSAVREGFRSRDSSPAPPRLAFTRSRDSSPLRERLRSPENRCTPQETAARISSLKAQLARCANELDNRSRQSSIRRRDKKPPSGRSISVDRGYLTKASLIHTGASQGYSDHDSSAPLSGSHYSASSKYSAHRDNRSPHSSGYREGALSPRFSSGSSPRHSAYSSGSLGGSESARRGYFSSTSNMTSHQIPVRLLDPQQTFNGHISSPLTTLHSRPTIDTTIEDTRSFIQERIERLYGPGALAAGFIKRSPSVTDSGGMGNTVKRTPNKRAEGGRVIPIQLDYTTDDQDKTTNEVEGSKGLPSVFRHLRPEFRHQLPLKSPGSGTAKIITIKRSDSGDSPLETNGHTIPVTFEGSPQSRPAASIVPPPLEAPQCPTTKEGAADASAVSNGALSNGSHPHPTSASQTKDVSRISGGAVQQSHNISISQEDDDKDVVCDKQVALPVVEQTPSVSGSSKLEDVSSPHNGCSASLLSSNKVAPTTQASEVSPPPMAAAPMAAATAGVEEVRDGHYFLKIVAGAVAQLEKEVAEIERELEQHSASMTEEVRGKVFAGTGKTKLLISQKIKQFSGLCHKNIAGQQGTDEFPTTCSDLAGFWDMVSLQVEDVHNLLKNLRAIRDNGWKELAPADTPDSASGGSRGAASSSSRVRRTKPAPTAAEKAKDEARKKAAEERRKAMRETMKAKRAAAAAEAAAGGQDDVEIFVPEN